MKKLLVLPFLVTIMSTAFARDCKVYGISDSPQKLTCKINNSIMNLRCIDGDYFLNASKVSVAYHMEVEEGAVPLVFKASDMQLTVVMESKVDIQAELLKGRKTFTGTCL
jgi:uncharacterized beta-barrel protein YwiB (DUF1934 family)